MFAFGNQKDSELIILKKSYYKLCVWERETEENERGATIF